MATPSNAINVPEPEPCSFNPNRRAGLLLQAQALHIREALLRHLEELASLAVIDPKSLKTEGEISAYIHHATAFLHTHSGRPKRK
jgi:hypothetical protein